VSTAMPSYKGHRYPVEIINHCVWLYFGFPLSFGEVEELMLERGVAVSYETIRRWGKSASYTETVQVVSR
jgi:putative transposase